MACKYELRKNPSKAPSGSKYYHARPMNNGKTDLNRICLDMNRGYPGSAEDVKAVIKNFVAEVERHLGLGENVHIDGLGDFQVTLACPPKTKHPEDIRAGSIMVKSVAYKPSKQLVNDLRRETSFERTHAATSNIQHCEALLPAVIEYFTDPANKGKAITSRYLADKACVSVQKASDMLHEMVAKGYLRNPSPDVHHPMYIEDEKLLQMINHNAGK